MPRANAPLGAAIGAAARGPLGAWLPAAAWAVVIFLLSTDEMSATNTRWLLEPPLRYLLPRLTPDAFEIFHFAIRKLAHFTEYLVFAVLLDRGFRDGSPVSAARAPLAALAAGALYSLTDEGHQMFVASRGPSLFDCGIDTLGAGVGAAVAALRAAARV